MQHVSIICFTAIFTPVNIYNMFSRDNKYIGPRCIEAQYAMKEKHMISLCRDLFRLYRQILRSKWICASYILITSGAFHYNGVIGMRT